MLKRPTQFGDGIIGRLEKGDDLLGALTAVVLEHGIRFARIEGLGAVQTANVAYYDQTTHTYEYMTLDRPLEILNLIGNVSIKDGEPMVHAHVTLGDRDGSAFGGHLGPGTIVFACEFVIQRLEAPPFNREVDDATGLPLWQE